MSTQFYALTETFAILQLDAEHAPAALRLYQHDCEQEGIPAQPIVLILDAHEYEVVRSAADAEAIDLDGDGLIPSYCFLTRNGQQPVFPHASVDNHADALEFQASYTSELVGPIPMAQIQSSWPALAGAAA